jgi:thiol-disulfide isomerase/thioredoxin
MLKRLPLLVLFFSLTAFISTDQVAKYKVDSLKERMNKGNDTTYVINFWATWCGPCVAELPYFTQLDSVSKKEKLRVILVSLDFKKDIETKLIPFIQKHKIETEVVFLNEDNDSEWIPKVDSTWQGNIPATLIVNTKTNYRHFIPSQTSFTELDSIVKQSRK